MASQNNRLEIVIAAKSDQFTTALKKLQQEAKTGGQGISNALTSGAKGGGQLEGVIDDVAASFGKVGGEAESAGSDIAKGIGKSEAEVQALEKKIASLIVELDRLSKVESELSALQQDFSKLSDSVKGAGDAADSIDFQTALDSAGKLKDSIAEVSGAILDTAAQSRDMERAIKGAFNDPRQADAFIKQARDLQDAYGDLVSADDIGQAVKRLDALGAASDKNLGRITKAAIDAGKDVSDAADSFGEALAPLESGNFDIGVFEELRTQYGIGAEALRKYGIEVDGNNKILGDTPKQQRKAQEALKKYLDESSRYADIATRNQDAQSRLSSEVSKFERSVGDGVNEIKGYIAEALLPLAKWLNTIPDGAKQAAAGITLAIAPLTAIGVAAGQAASVFKSLVGKLPSVGGAFDKAKGAASSFAEGITSSLPQIAKFVTGIGGSVLALGGLAVAAYETAKSYKESVDALGDVDKAQQALINTEQRALQQHKDILESRRKSVKAINDEAQAIEDYAQRRIKLTKAIIDANDQLTSAESSGDQKTIDAAQKRLDQLEYARKASDQLKANEVKAQKEIEKATEARLKAARDAYTNYKHEVDSGNFDSKKKALETLESLAAGLDPQSAKQAQNDLRSLRESVLSDELAALNKSVAAQKTSAKEAESIQAGLLLKYQANTDTRAKAEEQLTATIQAESDKRAAAAEKLAQREVELKKSAIAQQAALAKDSPELTALQHRLDKGEDVVLQIKAETVAQNAKLKTLADEEAALDKITIKRKALADIKADPGNASKIQEQAAEEQRQLDERTAAAKAKLDADLAAKNQGLDERRAKIQQDSQKKQADNAVKEVELKKQVLEEEQAGVSDIYAQRRKNLEDLAALGKDTSRELQALEQQRLKDEETAINKRLALAKEEISLKQKAADIGATPAEKELHVRQAQLEVEKAIRQARNDLQAVTDQDLAKLKEKTSELQKQYDIMVKQTDEKKKQQGFDTTFGTTYGLDQFNDNVGGFGKGRNQQELSDLKTQITRNQALIQSKEATAKAKGNSTTAPGDDASKSRTAEINQSERDRIASAKQTKEAGQAIGAGQVPAASPIDSGALLQTQTQANQILANILGGIQNLTAATKQAANPKPTVNNFADRNLTRRTERTLDF